MRKTNLRAVDSEYEMSYGGYERGIERRNVPILLLALSIPLTVLLILLTILVKIYAEYLFRVAFLATAFTIGAGALSFPVWIFISLRRYQTKLVEIPIASNGTILAYEGRQLQIVSPNEIFAVETVTVQPGQPTAYPETIKHVSFPIEYTHPIEEIDTMPDIPMRVLDTAKVEEAIQDSVSQDAIVKLKVLNAKREAQKEKLKKLLASGLSQSLVKTMLGIKSHEDFINLCHEAGLNID